jgi:hypothetical protein
VQARLDLIGNHGINTPLTFDAAKTLERRRDNAHPEMRFTTFARSRMAGMAGAFVLYRKDFRSESSLELRAQSVCHRS